MLHRSTPERRDTSARSVPWPARVLPSLTDLVFLFPLLFVLLKMQGVSTLLGDGDTGWHIRTGEWILANGHVPHADVFSFSKFGQPWFAWEWAWDVAFALIHRSSGLAGVVFVNLLILGAIFTLLFRLVRRECSNDLVAISLTMLALAGSSVHWLARPHLVSWFLILIFGHILSRASRGNTGLLWCLPFLMVPWANLHGGFFVGIALVFAYAIDPLLRVFSGKPNRFAPFAWCGLACLLASLINPYGYALHQHVLAYLLDSKQLDNILEFQSISFHSSMARYFEIMLALGTVAAYQGFKKRRITEALLILIWAHLALASIRNIPLFLLFAAPPVARMIDGWLSQFPRFAKIGAEFQEVDRIPRFHLVSAAAFMLLVLLMLRPGNPKLLRSEYDPSKYPAQAVEQLQAGERQSVFTDDEWGDYLIYRMYPSGRVFVDGRSDFYGAEFESRYLDVLNVRHDWESILERYGIHTALLRAEAPLAGAMKESRTWKLSYDDGIALIFHRESYGTAPLSAGKEFSPGSPDKGKEL